jgi:hypothetical protein
MIAPSEYILERREMIEREYDPVLLAFILDVKPMRLSKVKEQLVEAVSQMESDEKAYIYHPDNASIPRWVGQAVGCVANYKSADIDFKTAYKTVLGLMAEEDYDARRFLFVVVDGCYLNKSEAIRNKLDRIIEQKNLPVWDRQDIRPIIYQTEGVSCGNPWYECLTIDLDNLASYIKDTYKNGRTETSEEDEADEATDVQS